MQLKAGHKIEQPSAEETDVENAVLQAGSSSQSKAHGDPPCNQGAAGLLTLICKFPHLLIGPAFLFCLIVALGVFGIVYDTKASYDVEQQDAREEALSAAKSLSTQLTYELRATLSLAAVVKMNPHWEFLESNFPVLAEELFRQSRGDHTSSLELMELNLLPFGRIRAIMGSSIQRNSTADVFLPALLDEFQPYEAMAENELNLRGPTSVTNSEARAFSAGYPIFFNDTDEDESWGHPDNITHPTGCPGPPCYNPETRRKFWGFAGALIDAGPILRGDNLHLDRLLAHGLSYKLIIQPDGPQREGVFVRGGDHPDKVTASVTVTLPGTSWILTVYSPRQDDILALRDGLIAMVVVVAFIVSSLLLLLLLSAKRTSFLLKEQLVTNKLLQEEKVSREALLGRQLDLIACLEQGTRRTMAKSTSKLSEGQLNTIDQIQEAKAAISDTRRSKEEDINVQQLLAEGSFGKVYRGQWRGIDVAVKVIMLPKNMSGLEKREKMVVWEAAISSSLTHPNICQTYHYRIKPVKESARPTQKSDAPGLEVKPLSDVSSSRPRSSTNTESDNISSVPEEVHSYEVHLVLEYCDQSSLRDAMDAGAFMTPSGLNYAAQLDCALDVARAMFHLHCNNVLHLNLKTHNILLSSSSTEGKGLICKVSDFGLSVRMDHLETHVSSLFQGTLTHMAPEVMLKGTCSKASDMYAFGIVLWELFTGSSPFRDIPPALLGHSIVKNGKRPTWPLSVPKGYKDLASACWDQNPDARPTFEVILKALLKLREDLGTPTPPLKPFKPGQRPQNRPPHFQETFGSLSQPTLAQTPSHDVADSHPNQDRRATPSEAQALMEAWTQLRRNKQGIHHAEGPSAPLPTVPSPSPPTLTESQTHGRPATPSEAQALMAAWTQPRGNKQGIPHAEGPSAPLPTVPSPSPPTPTESQTHGRPATPSEARALMEAWLQPRGDKQGISHEQGPSRPHPAEPHHPERALTPCQAEVHCPKRTLVDASMGALSLKVQEGSPHTLSTGRQEEGKTGRIDLVCEQPGEGGLSHTQPSHQEAGHCGEVVNTPSPSLPGSLTKSAPPTPPEKLLHLESNLPEELLPHPKSSYPTRRAATLPEELLPHPQSSYPTRRAATLTEELPLRPSFCSVPTVGDPDAAEQRANGSSHGNSGCSIGACQCTESSKLNACINMPGPPHPRPLMTSAPATPPEELPHHESTPPEELLPHPKSTHPTRRAATLPEKLSPRPSFCSAPPVRRPDAAEQRANGRSHGSCSFGDCRGSSHMSCAGPSSHSRRSMGREWNEGEPSVSSSPGGGPQEPRRLSGMGQSQEGRALLQYQI